MGENLGFIVFVVGALFFALITMGLILAKLYKRASKEVSYVRTGLGGQKVIMDGGSIVLPVLHEVIPVNMNTLRLEVVRSNSAALITKDRMRVDVQAEFYVRVKPTEESIADAAQTLGYKSMNPLELKKLVEGKFVDSLRAVAAEMTMEELHEQRVDFVARVQRAVTEDLLKNGLELETVSLTGLDQTGKEYFNPDNAFDAQGLTKLTEEVEQRRKQRNDIEQDTEVAIRLKNLEAEKQKLAVARDEEYARLTQQQEIELQRASQATRIAQERANKDKESRESQIGAAQQVKTFEIVAERAVEEERIAKEKEIEARQIEKMKAIETAEVERRKAVELAEQERKIAIAEKSKAQSESEAEADKARALAVKAQELVVTVRDTEVAERGKQIELIEAAKAAEREAIKITVAAQAEKKVAEDNSKAVTTRAQGDADAERLRAEAAEVRYAVEAEGIRKRHEADNLLSSDQIAMQIKLAIIENLSEIVAQCVKPIEAIEGIRIVQVDGLNGVTGGGAGVVSTDSGSGRSSNLAEEVVSSALRYRAQAPLLDSLLKDVGISTDSLSGLTSVLGEVGTKDKE